MWHIASLFIHRSSEPSAVLVGSGTSKSAHLHGLSHTSHCHLLLSLQSRRYNVAERYQYGEHLFKIHSLVHIYLIGSVNWEVNVSSQSHI